jgi:multidrug efflux system membrane fusion protein
MDRFIRWAAEACRATAAGFFMEKAGNLRRGVWLVAALALTSGCGAPRADSQQKMAPPEVSVARVVKKSARDFSDFSGRLQAMNTVEVHPRVGGYVTSVEFKEGAHVKKGEPLFNIDARPFEYQVRRLDAERRRAESHRALAKADSARGDQLFQAGSIARAEFDRLSATDAESTAALDSVTAALALARLDVEFAFVRAPIDGRVSRALITPGNLVSTATLLTTLVSDGPLYVYFDVDEATFLRLTRTEKDEKFVQVGLSDEEGYPHRGSLDFLDNQVDPHTGTIRARAIMDNEDGRLTPGLFARARLVGGETFVATLIDDKAILTDQDRKYVYVLDGDNRAQRKNIVIGRMVDGLRVAQSGLDERDRIVVHGVQKIFAPGMPVKPREVAMGAPPPEPVASKHAGG